ncbi:ATP-grasp domain-containing protein [Patescibacteria group bacterium]|nr:ATP-grasp domain-containing protein [Patescibacteria group bacterium]
MTNPVVGVTALQAGWNPSPGVSVARSLHLARTNEMKIIGIDYDTFCTGLYLDIFDESYLLPPISKPDPLLETLSKIQAKTGLNVIIPNLDIEQKVYSRLQPELKEIGIHLLIPNEEVINLRSKLLITTFARKHNFLAPSTFALNSYEDLSCLPEEMNYPLIVKGHFCDAYPVISSEEAGVYISKLEEIWGWPVLIQDYIDGEEYCVAGLSDYDSKIIGVVAMKKFGLTDKGKVWAGVTVAEPELLGLTEKFIKEIDWVGPLEIDFVRDKNSLEFYIIDVNPRFPSWIYLAAKAGQNLPLAAVHLALGERVDRFSEYETGLMFVRSAEDLVFDIETFTKFMAEEEDSNELYRRV